MLDSIIRPESPLYQGVWSAARRRFLGRLGFGAGTLALQWLLQRDAVAASGAEPSPLAAKPPHHAATAKSVIFVVMEGGPSQMDSFDPKPELERLHGKTFQRGDVKSNQVRGSRFFVRSPFQFRRYGECGAPASELFPHVGACADDIAFLRSGYCDSDNHPAAVFQYTTGMAVQGSPSIGSWVVYGLGSENDDLPAYVVLRNGKPFGGTAAWSNGYLPAVYQGSQFRSGESPVLNLKSAGGISKAAQRNQLALLSELNARHQQPRRLAELEARTASYELAFRMQSSIPLAADVASESKATHRLYGLDQDATREFGRRCLLARRLVERGVRFVQIWAGGWDSHDNLEAGHRNAARAVDRPLAGLLTDLKRRGLLSETLVVWGGEFGRTADTTEAAWNKKRPGRDHNPRATPMWFAGGGVRGGATIGATDEIGENAVEKRWHLRDIHASLLHRLGLNQDVLTYYHAGRDKRLTDTGGELIPELVG